MPPPSLTSPEASMPNVTDVATATGLATASTPLTAAVSGVSQGDALSCLVAMNTTSGASTSATVTDSAGNTWTKSSHSEPGGTDVSVEIWTAVDVTPPATLTITPAASCDMAVTLLDLRGAAASSLLDAQAAASGTGTAPGSGNASPSSGLLDVLVGAIAIGSGAPIISGLPAWQNAAPLSFGAVVLQYGWSFAYGSGTAAYGCALVGSANWAAAVAALKPLVSTNVPLLGGRASRVVFPVGSMVR